ncbi:MAG: hypothetical protein WBE34_10700, partial [Candidatus Nitrosopolaris sp.]
PSVWSTPLILTVCHQEVVEGVPRVTRSFSLTSKVQVVSISVGIILEPSPGLVNATYFTGLELIIKFMG